jgi:hypothetical protein
MGQGWIEFRSRIEFSNELEFPGGLDFPSGHDFWAGPDFRQPALTVIGVAGLRLLVKPCAVRQERHMHATIARLAQRNHRYVLWSRPCALRNCSCVLK